MTDLLPMCVCLIALPPAQRLVCIDINDTYDTNTYMGVCCLCSASLERYSHTYK